MPKQRRGRKENEVSKDKTDREDIEDDGFKDPFGPEADQEQDEDDEPTCTCRDRFDCCPSCQDAKEQARDNYLEYLADVRRDEREGK